MNQMHMMSAELVESNILKKMILSQPEQRGCERGDDGAT